MSHENQPRTVRGHWRFLGKTKRIYVRVTPSEKEMIARRADQLQLTISDYMILAARLGNVKFLQQYLRQE